MHFIKNSMNEKGMMENQMNMGKPKDNNQVKYVPNPFISSMQNINIGKANNQNFTFIGHAKLMEKIKYKAQLLGIEVVVVEESYTSKASFSDKDKLPTYGEDDSNIKFSGMRVKRGLYKSKKGILINADVNGASNIIRKYDDKAFKNKKLSYLTKTVEKANI